MEGKDPNDQLQVANSQMQLSDKGVKLQTFSDLIEFSNAVHKSGLAPASMKSPESIMIAIQFGLEVGLTPMSALQNVAVINGMPSLYGDGAKALVLSSKVCEYIRERTEGSIENGDYVAICESKRIGEPPLITEFSMHDAKRAELWESTLTWRKYPKRMLMFRARGFNLRDNFTDILKGFKTAEEVADYGEVTIQQPSKRHTTTASSKLSDAFSEDDEVPFEEVDDFAEKPSKPNDKK